jgi:4-amino-4-deoxy-L-arabinose transferase-like glycosyltransferase
MLSDARSTRYWLIGIVVLGAALRFFGIWFGLSYPLARPDEETAMGLALAMQGGDLNPRFFHWPSFALYFFAALYAAASAVRRVLSLDPLSGVDHVLLARGAVACAGTLTIVVLFRIGRRVADAHTGVVAALLLAVAILHVRESHFAMTDVIMTLLLTSSLALLLRALDEEGETAESRWRAFRAFAGAGLAGGLATSTKYSAAVVLAAMGAAQLVWLSRNRKAIWSPGTWAPTVLFVSACALGFVAGTPYALLDSEKFLTDLQFDFTHLSGGHGLDLGRGWTYHVRRSLPYGAGIPVSVAAVAGFVPFARDYGRPAFVLGAFAAAFYLSIGSGYTVFFRYVLPLIPIVCLLAAIGILHTASWLAVRTGLQRALAVGIVTAVVAAPGLVNSAWFDVLLTRTDTRVLAGEWIASRLKPEDSLYDAGGNYTRLDLRHVQFHPWVFDESTGSFGHPEGATPLWLVLHESPLQLYASIPASLRRLAMEKYELVFSVRATRGRAASAVYDLQDAFFLPVSRFSTVDRPGPTIRIYRRRDAGPLPAVAEDKERSSIWTDAGRTAR